MSGIKCHAHPVRSTDHGYLITDMVIDRIRGTIRGMSEVDPDFALNRKRDAHDEYQIWNGVPAEDSGMMVWDSSKGATVDGVVQPVTHSARKANALTGAPGTPPPKSDDGTQPRRAWDRWTLQEGKHSARASTQHAANPFLGANGAARASALQSAMAAAVERWWLASALPDDALLRDGLLALEAGVNLEASARTLLARTALMRQRGVITAMRHVNDPERVASLVHEAWSTGALSEAALARLLADARLGSLWQYAMATDLRADLSSFVPHTVQRAQAGLRLLANQAAVDSGGDGAYSLTVDGLDTTRRWVFWVIALVVVAALAAWAVLQARTPDYRDVVTVPPSLHSVTAADGSSRTQTLAGYVIQRVEVTNAAYGACYAAGVCPFPTQRGAGTRTDYFLDDNYANYPVVNVTWDAATAYCAWLEMRLPTAAEFEVAARFAPLTDRYYAYPWGDAYTSAHVVDSSGFDAPAEVGSRSPHGDSPMGVADLAGNVAEWTSTLVDETPQMALVKGGSFREDGAALLPARSVPTLKTAVEEWLGFRCAATVLP